MVAGSRLKSPAHKHPAAVIIPHRASDYLMHHDTLLGYNQKRVGYPMQDTALLQEEILRLKEQKNAIILAHNYQRGEVQDIADVTGDSLELARAAAGMDGDVIVFCGSISWRRPLPSSHRKRPSCCPRGCLLPHGRDGDRGRARFTRRRYPEAAVVCYVNTTADVKAESDICCTSANAVKVVNAVHEDTVIFVPDKNLGQYAARFTDKKVLPWEGFCLVHDRYTPADVSLAKQAPRVQSRSSTPIRPEVIDLADHVASTLGIISHVKSAPENEFIIGTENGILHGSQGSARASAVIRSRTRPSVRT